MILFATQKCLKNEELKINTEKNYRKMTKKNCVQQRILLTLAYSYIFSI